MVDNILILGNGFDLAMGRNTSYENFLRFTDYIYLCVNFPLDGSYNEDNNEVIPNSISKETISEIEKAIKLPFYEILTDNDFEEVLETVSSLNISDLLSYYSYDILNLIEKNYRSCQQQIAIEVYPDYVGLFDGSWYNFIIDKLDACVECLRTLNNGEKNKDYIPFDINTIVNLTVFQSGNDDSISIQSRNLSWLNRINDNLFIKYIKQNKESLGNNWSNVELTISDIAEAILSLRSSLNEIDQLFSKNPTYPREDQAKMIKEKFINEQNYIAFSYIIDFLSLDFVVNPEKNRVNMIEELNEKFITELEQLTDYLEFYLTYLGEIDFSIRNIEKNKTILDEVSNIEKSKVITFNYTNTANELLNIPKENTHFIHGEIKFNRNADEINTMVFGIEDKENDIDKINPELIPYQKFYQRTVKETGNKFEEFFKPNFDFSADGDISIVSKNIIVFGHSVDPLDKEIFQKCFELANQEDEKVKYPYKFIFVYHDERAKRSIVKNLAIILGKQELIQLTGKQKIVFVKSDDNSRMKKELLE
ncbi:AbiH family protein [Streptococcus mutans]|uniref:AbiH family protein n=1 Tax=Streptococcus mutans TaxID=1309 RepID=UPI0014551C76|nr:AbiH family protein [Streptococcus mutans]NLQ49260.1 hypothetical protein [Streptococcus mutans]